MESNDDKQVRRNEFLRKLYEKWVFYAPGIHFTEIDKELGINDDFYIPAESKGDVLEQMPEFIRYKEPSKLFLRFAEYYLSNGKADSKHYHTLSFKNCLLRIPGSYNSKNSCQVKIVQKWDGATKVPIHLLYAKFMAYLIVCLPAAATPDNYEAL